MDLVDQDDAQCRVPLHPKFIDDNISAKHSMRPRVKIASMRWILNHLQACLEQCLNVAACRDAFSERTSQVRASLFSSYARLHPLSWADPPSDVSMLQLTQRPCKASTDPFKMCIQELGTRALAFHDETPTQEALNLVLQATIPTNSSDSAAWFTRVLAASLNRTASLPFVSHRFVGAADALETAIRIAYPLDRDGFRWLTPMQAEELRRQASTCLFRCRWKDLAAFTVDDVVLVQNHLSLKFSYFVRLICESQECIAAVREAQWQILRKNGLGLLNVYLPTAQRDNGVAAPSVLLDVFPSDVLYCILATTIDGLGAVVALGLIVFVWKRNEASFLKLMLLILTFVMIISLLRIALHFMFTYSYRLRITNLNPASSEPLLRFALLAFWTESGSALALLFVVTIVLVQWVTALAQLLGKESSERRIGIFGFGSFVAMFCTLLAVQVWQSVTFRERFLSRSRIQGNLYITLSVSAGLALVATASTIVAQLVGARTLWRQERQTDARGVLLLAGILGLIWLGIVLRLLRYVFDGLLPNSQLSYIDATLGQALITWSLCLLCFLAIRAHLQRVGKLSRKGSISDQSVPLLNPSSKEIPSQYEA